MFTKLDELGKRDKINQSTFGYINFYLYISINLELNYGRIIRK